jgi:Tfp pilus assembly protein PilO
MEIAAQKRSNYATLMPLPKDSRNYLAKIFLLLLIIGAGYWFMVSPKMVTQNTKKDQLSQLTKEREDLASSISTFNKLVSDLNSHSQDAARLDEALPLQSKSFRMNLLIRKLAETAGVTVQDVNFSEKAGVIAGSKDTSAQPFAGTRTLQKFTGSVAVTGNFDNIQAFIKNVENNSRIMDIQNFDISGSSDGALSLKLNLITYSYE